MAECRWPMAESLRHALQPDLAGLADEAKLRDAAGAVAHEGVGRLGRLREEAAPRLGEELRRDDVALPPELAAAADDREALPGPHLVAAGIGAEERGVGC